MYLPIAVEETETTEILHQGPPFQSKDEALEWLSAETFRFLEDNLLYWNTLEIPGPAYIATLIIVEGVEPDVAFVYIDHHSGKQAAGIISGSADNLRCALRDFRGAKGWNHQTIVTTRTIQSVREWKAYIKGLAYAGCRPDEIQAFILKELEK